MNFYLIKYESCFSLKVTSKTFAIIVFYCQQRRLLSLSHLHCSSKSHLFIIRRTEHWLFSGWSRCANDVSSAKLMCYQYAYLPASLFVEKRNQICWHKWTWYTTEIFLRRNSNHTQQRWSSSGSDQLRMLTTESHWNNAQHFDVSGDVSWTICVPICLNVWWRQKGEVIHSFEDLPLTRLCVIHITFNRNIHLCHYLRIHSVLLANIQIKFFVLWMKVLFEEVWSL